MQNLWSPWRSEYISSSDAREHASCFLCMCAAATEATVENLVVAQFKHTIVVMNRYPYNAGHLLIAPREHIGELDALQSDVAHEFMDVLQTAVRITREVLQPHGCNVGANLGRVAGAGVPDHLHMHVLPRWSGDTNFMPTIAETKVISESIAETWRRFNEAFASAPKP